jgi:uncharacterized protein (DUF1015 family)
MASVRPFRALRPRPEVAPQVAAVPYDVVSVEEARRMAAGRPLSFLHVSRAEIDLADDVDPYAPQVYERAAENFHRLVSEALVVEDEPSLYFYRLRMGDHEQTGLAGCYSVAEYARDIIKKHERTRRDKEDDRTRHIIDLRAQTGPVFLTYRHHGDVDAIAARVTASAPLYDFGADDGVTHTVWRCDRASAAAIVKAFASLPALYIADGHHRAASAARASERFAGEGENSGDAEHGWFLAVAFPDDQTRILPYNRLVKDLGSLSPEAFIGEVSKRFPTRPGSPEPREQGTCAMYIGGRWYDLSLQAGAAPDPADPSRTLDVARLQDGLLAPVLGIADPRTDKRLDFMGGIRGTAGLERAVNAGRAAVAFSMYPVTVADLMAIADAGAIMPPKSTWFEPKLRDGLLTHTI